MQALPGLSSVQFGPLVLIVAHLNIPWPEIPKVIPIAADIGLLLGRVLQFNISAPQILDTS